MKTILLVSNDVNFIKMKKQIVERDAFVECRMFPNPVMALFYVQQNPHIDEIIVDYKMVQMNGFIFSQRVINLGIEPRIIVYSNCNEKALQFLRKQYNLEDKVEISTTTDIDSLMYAIS